ncbi:cyclin-B1-2-like [Dioscorea cayenensis subsp. rotundata]|uniref:Cyclin-B1-2-like n=1 Tax=Dioscorea cayennensis subsp. rotundata TaxID=55577 RepID=A0AB40B4U9_DIOCR|nr:cyclin-B1-2-like [Dioscorea cayenensis subsp. rotundata]
MAISSSKSIDQALASNHDTLRLGLDGVKGGIVGAHPLESLRESERRFWEEKKRMGCDLCYGSAFNLRKDLDRQIFARFKRPPGAIPSSMLGLEALTGSLDDFGFEDYLNVPQDSEVFRPADMHHGMEVHLGLSKGPVCPNIN